MWGWHWVETGKFHVGLFIAIREQISCSRDVSKLTFISFKKKIFVLKADYHNLNLPHKGKKYYKLNPVKNQSFKTLDSD